jgi:hypothetical protein
MAWDTFIIEFIVDKNHDLAVLETSQGAYTKELVHMFGCYYPQKRYSTKSATSPKGPLSSGDLQGSPERPRDKSHDSIGLENSGERVNLIKYSYLETI